jgi:plasmid stability protein
MTPESRSFEAELREIQASALDEELLARLEAAADGTLTELSASELRFEQLLRRTSPAKLDSEFLGSLEAIVRDTPFGVDEKVVLFPITHRNVIHKRSLWSAAAAVAIMGALAALIMPAGKPTAQTVAQSRTSAATANTPNFVPASFNRALSEVNDEGVIWKPNNQPHSLVRVVYKDQITLKDAQGRTVEVEKPSVEYILVPAKTD